MNIFLTFIGNNDCLSGQKPGAILSILNQRRFGKVCLFYNHDGYLKAAADISDYCRSCFPNTEVIYQEAPAQNPTDYNIVYPSMYKAIREILKQNPGAKYTISLTSGTPTMHACWIFLRQGGVIDAELIQISRAGQISEITFELDDFPKIQRVDEIKAEMTRLARENEGLKSDLELDHDNIVGHCPEILKVKEDIRLFAGTDIPVFIQGESGTGKELAAEAIHYNSLRKKKPFIKVNCGAIPPELFESEFFGHKKGSFTGAVSDKHGKFRLADHGTIFLDEIADLPKMMQVKLLRVIEYGTFTQVGGSGEEKVDVRILSATNKDLREEVSAGNFREDLFYRLVRAVIALPPLRDRGNDKVMIARHIISQLDDKYSKRKTLDKSALDLILKHNWPGNVRQLKNTLETAYVISGDEITPENMNIIEIGRSSDRIVIPDDGIDLDNEIVPKYYEAALKKTHGNQARAARLLGLEPPTFRARLRKLSGVQKLSEAVFCILR